MRGVQSIPTGQTILWGLAKVPRWNFDQNIATELEASICDALRTASLRSDTIAFSKNNILDYVRCLEPHVLDVNRSLQETLASCIFEGDSRLDNVLLKWGVPKSRLKRHDVSHTMAALINSASWPFLHIVPMSSRPKRKTFPAFSGPPDELSLRRFLGEVIAERRVGNVKRVPKSICRKRKAIDPHAIVSRLESSYYHKSVKNIEMAEEAQMRQFFPDSWQAIELVIYLG